MSVALIGLLVHNAVDGFALGVSSASAASGHSDASGLGVNSLGLLVFAAILLHKAPAALAFSTYLLQQKKTRAQGMYILLSWLL